MKQKNSIIGVILMVYLSDLHLRSPHPVYVIVFATTEHNQLTTKHQ